LFDLDETKLDSNIKDIYEVAKAFADVFKKQKEKNDYYLANIKRKIDDKE